MNKPDFDWSLVRSFLAALEHGSLLAAARATGVSQPTLGRHIAELEEQLGTVLFERTGRGLSPTAGAVRLADAARAMESGAVALWRAARGTEKALRGTVRLSASQPVACALLPAVLGRMREAMPEVEVELVVSNALSNLLRREADIAVRMVRPDQASLVAKRIATVTVVACAHRDYLRRRGTPRRPEDLVGHEVITGDRHDEIRPGFTAMGYPAEAQRFLLRTDDLIAYWEAVRAGLGVGFVAAYLLRTDNDVLPILPMLKLPRLPMWLTVHREIRSNVRIRAVYDFLAAEIPAALAG